MMVTSNWPCPGFQLEEASLVPGENPLPGVQVKVMVSPQDLGREHRKLALGRGMRREFQTDEKKRKKKHEGEKEKARLDHRARYSIVGHRPCHALSSLNSPSSLGW